MKLKAGGRKKGEVIKKTSHFRKEIEAEAGLGKSIGMGSNKEERRRVCPTLIKEKALMHCHPSPLSHPTTNLS